MRRIDEEEIYFALYVEQFICAMNARCYRVAAKYARMIGKQSERCEECGHHCVTTERSFCGLTGYTRRGDSPCMFGGKVTLDKSVTNE